MNQLPPSEHGPVFDRIRAYIDRVGEQNAKVVVRSGAWGKDGKIVAYWPELTDDLPTIKVDIDAYMNLYFEWSDKRQQFDIFTPWCYLEFPEVTDQAVAQI